MRNKKRFLSIILSSAILSSSCFIPKIENATLEGVIISEDYQANKIYKFADILPNLILSDSKYSFVLDTKYGEKKIEIYDSIFEHESKESINTLLNLGDRIKLNIPKQALEKNRFRFSTDDFLKSLTD